MTQAEIKQLIQKQRTFFHSDATLDVEYRIHALQKLKACILKYENEINIAIRADLGKCAFESYMCETGLVLSELTYMLKHTRKFSKERTVRTPLAQFHIQELSKTVPIWCHTDYESMELSVHAHYRAVGRCAGSRKHRNPEAKCLFCTYYCSDQPYDPGMLR